MNNRDWFCLALRLFGIWLLIGAIETIVPYLIYVVLDENIRQTLITVVWMLIWLVGRSAMGLALLLFAPAIAARFYPNGESAEALAAVEHAKPLKVGIQLLGVYAMFLGVQAGASLLLRFFSIEDFGSSMGFNYDEAGYNSSLMTFGLNLAFGAVLIIWNERVVALIEKFRYVPERDAYERPGSEGE